MMTVATMQCFSLLYKTYLDAGARIRYLFGSQAGKLFRPLLSVSPPDDNVGLTSRYECAADVTVVSVAICSLLFAVQSHSAVPKEQR